MQYLKLFETVAEREACTENEYVSYTEADDEVVVKENSQSNG